MVGSLARLRPGGGEHRVRSHRGRGFPLLFFMAQKVGGGGGWLVLFLDYDGEGGGGRHLRKSSSRGFPLLCFVPQKAGGGEG